MRHKRAQDNVQKEHFPKGMPAMKDGKIPEDLSEEQTSYIKIFGSRKIVGDEELQCRVLVDYVQRFPDRSGSGD